MAYNINFNPQPTVDPLQTAYAGVNQGLSMGLGLQQMQAQKQQMELATKQQALQVEQAEQARAQKALEWITNKQVANNLSNETKTKIYRQAIIPFVNKSYGLDINPEDFTYDEKTSVATDRLTNLVKAGAPKELIMAEYQVAILGADEDDLPILKEFGTTLKPETTGTPKAPPGYRWTTDGGLEAIPGGPADLKAAKEQDKADAIRNAAVNQADRIIGKVDQALNKVSGWSAGLGAKLSAVPSSDAKDLAADLQTIKANLGFAELQAMRQASPTGGALGSIATQELESLQATLASLDQSQSPDQLKERLTEIKTHYQNWRKAVLQAGQQPEAAAPVAAPAAAMASSGGVKTADDYLRKLNNGR